MANEHGRFKCVRRLMAWRLGRSCPTLSSQKHVMTRYFIPNAVVRALLFRCFRPTLLLRKHENEPQRGVQLDGQNIDKP